MCGGWKDDYGQERSGMVRNGQEWSGMVKSGQEWSRVVRNGQEWSGVTRNGWSEMVKNGQGLFGSLRCLDKDG